MTLTWRLHEYVNPAFERVTGYTSGEIIGGNPRILKSGLMPDELYQNMWKTISAGDVWKGELCNRKKNGNLFWELGTVSPIRNKDGVITNYISVKEDITERKKNEQELNRYRQQLEELVELRAGGFNRCNRKTPTADHRPSYHLPLRSRALHQPDDSSDL